LRSRALLFFALAIFLAIVTVHFVRQRLNAPAPTVVVAPPSAATSVLVAANDLASGTLLGTGDLRWQSWPDDRVDGNYIVKGKGDMQSMVGAVVRSHIAAGEPVAAGMVIKPGERGFLAAVLAPGMDAVSAPISPVSAAGGLVLPGDRVDLILEHQIIDPSTPGALPRLVGETVLVNLRVVAIDQSIGDVDKKALDGRTVTFEVTPKQAETVEVAKQLGTLSLALRSVATGDPAIASAVGSYTWDSDVSPLLERRAAKRGGAGVEIVRGDVGGGGGGITTASSPDGSSGVSIQFTSHVTTTTKSSTAGSS